MRNLVVNWEFGAIFSTYCSRANLFPKQQSSKPVVLARLLEYVLELATCCHNQAFGPILTNPTFYHSKALLRLSVETLLRLYQVSIKTRLRLDQISIEALSRQ